MYFYVKRGLDVAASAIGLILVAPLLVLAAVAVKLSSRGPVFFRQERMGQDFKPFRIFKFRTMVTDAPQQGAQITAGADPRVTAVGRFLRKSKIDELAQLMNVLRGDMSLVGPRPEVPKYVEMFRDEYREILRVRPGITDPASIKYRDESAILGQASDPERTYVEQILPDKIAIARDYVAQQSFLGDIAILCRTLAAIVR
jgi:lipopolysaccharide/colanic/teichoic acid biosynthesis glycosyltransferase